MAGVSRIGLLSLSDHDVAETVAESCLHGHKFFCGNNSPRGS